MSKKLDITSTALEKGIDLAKYFLDKLIGPAIEETGLLLKDKVTLWKFKNQVRMLNKAKDYCEKHEITTKAISLKLLCPLLDYAALEEDEILQDKWAVLLSNMVDSQQNVENHVFPYLLSQISTDEFLMIEAVLDSRTARMDRLSKELISFREEKPALIDKIDKEIEDLEKVITSIKQKDEGKHNPLIWQTRSKIGNLEHEKRKIEENEKAIIHKIKEPEFVPYGDLQEYEVANLVRLGIMKSIQNPYAYVSGHQIQNNPHEEYLSLDDLQIEIESDEEDFILTELGEKLIEACNEK